MMDPTAMPLGPDSASWRRPPTVAAWNEELTSLNHVTTVFDSLDPLKRIFGVLGLVSASMAVLINGPSAAAWLMMACMSFVWVIVLVRRAHAYRSDPSRQRLDQIQPVMVTTQQVEAFASTPLLWNELALLQKSPVPLLQGDLDSLQERWEKDPSRDPHHPFLDAAKHPAHVWKSVVVISIILVLAITLLMASFQWGRFAPSPDRSHADALPVPHLRR